LIWNFKVGSLNYTRGPSVTISLSLFLCTKPPKLLFLLTRSPSPNSPPVKVEARCWPACSGDGERRWWGQRGGEATRVPCAPVQARNWREMAWGGGATEACGRRRGGALGAVLQCPWTTVDRSESCLGMWWSSSRGQFELGKAGRGSSTVDRHGGDEKARGAHREANVRP
jgi:hypothetical protein